MGNGCKSKFNAKPWILIYCLIIYFTTMTMNNQYKINRRAFIKQGAAVYAGLTIVPSNVISGLGHKSPSDKLNIAAIGIGGKGNSNLYNLKSENIVALCDVDWKYAKHVFNEYPAAKAYWDFRKMYDEMEKSIDAIVIATPDHTHCVAAAMAMELGKHTYVQKPLTHTVYESRLLTKLADSYKIATQMGNEGASSEGVNLVVEWIQNGEIGEVRKVEAFTDRPIWPQGLSRPNESEKTPDTLNWDLFLGPAQYRPFNSIYTPWNWRGWWDFGTGALGDMACHILHPVYKSLKLKYPNKVQASSTLLLTESPPNAEIVKFTFPERKSSSDINIALPEVMVYWYDGGLLPEKPQGWPDGKDLNDGGGGVIFHGTKDMLICGVAGDNPWLLSGRIPNVAKTERRIENENHEMDWVRACKENSENRVATKSDFSEAGPFNEMVLMGVLAVRLQGLNKELEWDGENMEFTNIGEDESLRICISDNFSIVDGNPSFNREWTEPMNALEFSNELIKHSYREGWKLPNMPI